MTSLFQNVGGYRKVEPSTSSGDSETIPKPTNCPQPNLGWSTARVMFGALTGATILAIGHHLFYLHFDNASVSTSIDQQWMSRIGTAFAFGVKMFAALAAGTAYVQLQWLVFHYRPYKLPQVDSMNNVLRDITAFWDFKIWIQNPILAVLALVPWLIPFAAVITPGTLTMRGELFENHTTTIIPQLLFNATEVAEYDTAGGGDYGYRGPSNAVSRIMYATSTLGTMLQLPSQYQNMSYDMSFYGPGVQCSLTNVSMAEGVATALQNESTQEEGSKFLYFSFVPGDPKHSAPTYYDGASEPYQTLDDMSTDSARLFIAHGTPDSPIRNATDLIECRLGNSSYHVHFQFAYPLQSIDTLNYQRINDVGSFLPSGVFGPLSDYYSDVASYQAIMEAFGAVLVGMSEADHYGGIYTESTSYAYTAINWTTAGMIMAGLETLFQNATLSMLSIPQLMQDSAQTSLRNITISTFINIYVYDARNLYLAYGITLGCAFLCTLVGLHAIRKNKAGYSNKFSTVLRATCRVDNCEFVDPNDNGSDPLPESLATATVTLST